MVFSPFLSKVCAHKSEMLLLFKKEKRRTKKKKKIQPLYALKKSLPELLAGFPPKPWTPSKLGTKFRPQLGKAV